MPTVKQSSEAEKAIKEGQHKELAMQTVTGYLLIFSASLLFSLIGPISLFAMSEGVAPLEVAFWRAFVGGASFLVHALLIGAWRI